MHSNITEILFGLIGCFNKNHQTNMTLEGINCGYSSKHIPTIIYNDCWYMFGGICWYIQQSFTMIAYDRKSLLIHKHKVITIFIQKI